MAAVNTDESESLWSSCSANTLKRTLRLNLKFLNNYSYLTFYFSSGNECLQTKVGSELKGWDYESVQREIAKIAYDPNWQCKRNFASFYKPDKKVIFRVLL